MLTAARDQMAAHGAPSAALKGETHAAVATARSSRAPAAGVSSGTSAPGPKCASRNSATTCMLVYFVSRAYLISHELQMEGDTKKLSKCEAAKQFKLHTLT